MDGPKYDRKSHVRDQPNVIKHSFSIPNIGFLHRITRSLHLEFQRLAATPAVFKELTVAGVNGDCAGYAIPQANSGDLNLARVEAGLPGKPSRPSKAPNIGMIAFEVLRLAA